MLGRATAAQMREELKSGADYADSGYVAVNGAGEPSTPDLTRMWIKATKAAAVRRFRHWDATNSCGTALHLRGVPSAVIKKWLGADAETTAQSQDDALVDAGKIVSAARHR